MFEDVSTNEVGDSACMDLGLQATRKLPRCLQPESNNYWSGIEAGVRVA